MSSPSDGPHVIEDAVCLGCGCLCDDITVHVQGSRIVSADRVCEAGRSWFLDPHDRDDWPEATVDGQPADLATALRRVHQRLAIARAPLMLGLSTLTNQAQAAALALADRIGAAIAPSPGGGELARMLAALRTGTVGSSWGEVRARADLVLFWGVDPLMSHPRLWERIIEAPGRFVPSGRDGRVILAADSAPSPLFDRADLTLTYDRGGQVEALWALRALALGRPIDLDRAARSTRIPAEALAAFGQALRSARYGVIFAGPWLARSRAAQAAVEALYGFTRDLQETQRFVVHWLTGPGNAAGAESVLTRQTGAPCAVDFATGAPDCRPGDVDAYRRMERGESDAVLEFAAPGGPPAADHPRPTPPPMLRLGPGVTAPGAPRATVAISTAIPGLTEPGTFVRSDGLSLIVRSLVPTTRPTAESLLRTLLARMPSAATEPAP